MLLEIELWSVRYGAGAAVRDVTLHVDRGEIVALLGPNGAGKTTLLRSLAGLVRPFTGEGLLDGAPLRRLNTDQIARRGMVLVPDDRGIFPSLTVDENLRMGGYHAGAEAAARMARVTAHFPVLAERHDQRAGSLSGGQQQQLAIGKALMAGPRLLLLDEMSLGLGPLVIEDLFRALRRINGEGTAVLLVEQRVPQALAIADRAYVMDRGRIVIEGRAAAVSADAARLSAAYLGAEPAAEEPAAPPAAQPAEHERITVPLTARDKRSLQTLADREGRPVGELVSRLIGEHIARHASEVGR